MNVLKYAPYISSRINVPNVFVLVPFEYWENKILLAQNYSIVNTQATH